MFRCAVPALFLLWPFLAASQTAPRSPEFEADSVKPVPAGKEYGGMRGGPGTSSPGQVHYDATTLRAVIARAYSVQRFQIAGPKWFDDERFDIVAKIAPGTTMAQFQLMLQKLLADRFHLELHKENRTLSAYEMTVAKSGLKMPPVPLPATPRVPSASPAQITAMSWTMAGERIQVHGHAATIRQILVWLSEQTGREIVDKTGLTEAYDFELSWTAASAPEPDDPSSAGIIDAAIEKGSGFEGHRT